MTRFLTNKQFEIVAAFAQPLPPDKRAVFLERVAARLNLCGRFGDGDVADAATFFDM